MVGVRVPGDHARLLDVPNRREASGREVRSMAQYNRNSGNAWTRAEVKQLRTLAAENTPTRVIGLKLGRTEAAVRTRASDEGISLKPTNQSPYGSK